MGVLAEFAPAVLRRAFFVFAGLLVAAVYAGPASSPAQAPLAQVGKPDAAETARILEQFRRSGWFGYVEFDLKALPRRGKETVYKGRLWGGYNDKGAITRMEVTDAKGAVHRFLLQNGEMPAVWRVTDGQVAQLQGGALFHPLIPGVEVTPFDLQMPYLYWPEVSVERVARVRGRPAYEFLFTPPAPFSARSPEIRRVRAYFDAQFSAPVQTEVIGQRGTIKTLSLVDLKKVGEDWIPKSFDIRNDVSRDKTKFLVTGAALRLEFPAKVFEPASLTEPLAPPAADRILRIE